MFKSLSKSKGLKFLCFASIMFISLPSNAGLMGMWSANGWSQLDAEDGATESGFVGPGWGGQAFDAEYLFYKKEGSILSIGLQTGFDLSDGHQWYGRKEYFAGDLSLGFNGGGYQYAIDFGLVTKDIQQDNVGLGNGNQDTAGLYAVSQWNNDISYGQSSPFAMDEGSFLSAITGTSGSANLSDGKSYYRTVSFDLNSLGFDVASFDAHWTMSCGNDVVEGSANVPEPNPSWLLIGGLLALIGSRGIKTTFNS
ncbi:MAG: hypothetical protein KZQ93_01530 [Candidatus Thiodiazotropha sp. (ex Monitilora ramsayi)]|nr:hypothetical protein [Candidatus Thiodiazotropha sp. (ex Monitilora ramsayi)]